jgi:hypothetical protein
LKVAAGREEVEVRVARAKEVTDADAAAGKDASEDFGAAAAGKVASEVAGDGDAAAHGTNV